MVLQRDANLRILSPPPPRWLLLTLALLNMPCFSDTTMNCEAPKCVRIMWPMFWVCDKSSAASTCGCGMGRRGMMAVIAKSSACQPRTAGWPCICSCDSPRPGCTWAPA